MLEALRHVLEAEPGVAYALLFGSGARGTAHPGSDADVAVELTVGASRDVQALGGLAARLESAAARRLDLVPPYAAPAVLPNSADAFGERSHRPRGGHPEPVRGDPGLPRPGRTLAR